MVNTAPQREVVRRILWKCLLQEPLQEKKVRCNTCNRRCVVEEGKTGWCRTRTVRNGRLYALTYGRISSLSSNPIEKKPFYHFYPGSYALTAGSWSCNFACPWCQNWHISKAVSGSDRFVSAEDFIAETIRRRCRGTSISFNEPTLSMEWALAVFRAAQNQHPPLYNTFVSNGYMTAEALKLLAEAGLDAINVDIKGNTAVYSRYCRADVEKVWQTCKLAKNLGIHLEITTLVIPGVNDEEKELRLIASRIADELGSGIPWHVTAYFPSYDFDTSPTSAAAMMQAQSIGKESGLNFVYIGNIEGAGSNTFCPACGVLLAERSGFDLVRCDVTPTGKCPKCHTVIPGTGWDWISTR